jgi:hypothetical protein
MTVYTNKSYVPYCSFNLIIIVINFHYVELCWIKPLSKVIFRFILNSQFHVKQSKYEPIVEGVTLLDGNAEYAYIQLPDGRETTVSTQHLAPAPEISCDPSTSDSTLHTSEVPLNIQQSSVPDDTPHDGPVLPDPLQDDSVRQSRRVRRPPAYLSDYSLN